MIKKMQSVTALVFMLLALISGRPEIRVTADQKSFGNQIYLPVVAKSFAVESLGPDGGGVTWVVFNPQNPAIAYVGSWGAGVFKSQDGGKTGRQPAPGWVICRSSPWPSTRSIPKLYMPVPIITGFTKQPMAERIGLPPVRD